MSPYLRVFCLAIIFLYLLVCRSACQTYEDKYANDFAFQGNRQLWRCHKDDPNGQAAKLKNLLNKIDGDLPTILSEANRGTGSPNGFGLWFKTNDNIGKVTNVFSNVQNSPEIHVTVSIFPDKPIAIPELPLTFVCINEDDIIFQQYYDHCMRDVGGGIKVTGFAPWGTALIMICPFFWDYDPVPDSMWCPRHDKKGKYLTSNGLGWNQYGILIHEMVEKYIHTQGQGLDEVYTFQSMASLLPEKTVDNPQTFTMFACSVSVGCTDWPEKPKRRHLQLMDREQIDGSTLDRNPMNTLVKRAQSRQATLVSGVDTYAGLLE